MKQNFATIDEARREVDRLTNKAATLRGKLSKALPGDEAKAESARFKMSAELREIELRRDSAKLELAELEIQTARSTVAFFQRQHLQKLGEKEAAKARLKQELKEIYGKRWKRVSLDAPKPQWYQELRHRWGRINSDLLASAKHLRQLIDRRDELLATGSRDANAWHHLA
jgi:DNA repair exonuclease SbcCD ATPase subunit